MNTMKQLDPENFEVIDIFKFSRKYFPSQDSDKVKNMIWMHWFYGTIDSIRINGKIVAVVRWNISADAKVCHVIDLFIKKGTSHGILLMKHFIARNWGRFPTVQYIKFARIRKYKKRENVYIKLLKY